MTDVSLTPVSDFDAAVRLLSGGTNVAIYNDLGLPSIYVRKDKGLISDVIEGGPDTTHYAFKVNGTEVPAFYMGKYLATVYKGRALSLPLQDPKPSRVSSVDMGDALSTAIDFDNAKHWCEANGAGFHLPTIAEYAWIALLSRKNDTMPHGNNNYGTNASYPHEEGVASIIENEKITYTLTGSGPATWNDNWRPDGICDLNGNVYEWQGGFRTVDGELQIFADNDAAMQYGQGIDSTLWRAILQDGTLVAPGTEGTLKWDYTKDPGTTTGDNGFCLNTKLTYQQTNNKPRGVGYYTSLKPADGVSVPDRLKALALMPVGNESRIEDIFYMRNIGEYIYYRGGDYSSGKKSGIFALSAVSSRNSYGLWSFRPAFIPGI